MSSDTFNNDKVQIEEIDDDEADIPELEQADEVEDEADAGADFLEDKKMNRQEKKSRKAFDKLKLKKVDNVERVAIRRGKDATFFIDQPDVYRSPGSDCYVVFGQPNVGADQQAALQEQAGQFANDTMEADLPDLVTGGAGGSAELEEDDDESGLDPDEIATIVSQTNVSRGIAVAALRKHNNVVDAILELSP